MLHDLLHFKCDRAHRDGSPFGGQPAEHGRDLRLLEVVTDRDHHCMRRSDSVGSPAGVVCVSGDDGELAGLLGNGA